MSRTCETCRWWSELGGGHVMVGVCGVRLPPQLRRLVTEGGQITYPNEGCVLHTPKEPTP
jgi:hypothetical protein